MREPNKNYVYDLSELTSEELKEIYNATFTPSKRYKFLYFEGYQYHYSDDNFHKTTTNAKELFYTLENVQVDCRDLSEEQIKEMADVFKANGFRIGSLDFFDGYYFLRDNGNNYCMVNQHELGKNTITYSKFMELFGSKSEQNVEVSKEFCKLLTEEISRQPTQEEIASIFSSREKESEKRDLKLKKTLKYLLKKDIILTPKQYKKLWKKS